MASLARLFREGSQSSFFWIFLKNIYFLLAYIVGNCCDTVWIVLHCTIARSPPSHPMLNNYKKVSIPLMSMKPINPIRSSSSPLFTLLPTSTLPHTVPVLQSCLSLLFQSQCLKAFLNVSQLWICFTLVSSVPSVTLLFPLPSYPPLFGSLQYISLCCLPAQMWNILILLTLYHSLFLSLLPWVQ
jgi:hypothetical protein